MEFGATAKYHGRELSRVSYADAAGNELRNRNIQSAHEHLYAYEVDSEVRHRNPGSRKTGHQQLRLFNQR